MEKSAERLNYILLCFFLLLASPVFAQGAARPGGKSFYLTMMVVLFIMLIILLVWELIDSAVRKKRQPDATSGTINVVEDEPQEDDPFKVLLKEESAASARPAPLQRSEMPLPKTSVETAELTSPDRAKPTQELTIQEVPEEKKPRRKITVELGQESAEEPELMPEEKATEEKNMIKMSEPAALDQQGWADLMQQASKDREEKDREEKEAKAARSKKPLFEEAKPVTPVREARPPAGIPSLPPPPEEDDDDPWKALLKKSKQEEETTREEEKPWSSLLKSDKSSVPEKAPHLQVEVDEKPQSLELKPELLVMPQDNAPEPPDMAGQIITTHISVNISPEVLEKPVDAFESSPALKESPLSSGLSLPPAVERERGGEAGEETKTPLLAKDEEIISLDLKSAKKKEDESDEKKSSSKDSIPVFMKKASRIISIPTAEEKSEDKDESKPGILSVGREHKRVIKLEGLSFDKKDKEEENS
jgi:hypothetical protein